MKWSEERMQYALTTAGSLFDFGRYSVVPNVSWGLGLTHEADLLCLSKSGVFHEVEIKVTMSDLKNDKKKKHGHYSRFIKHLWFAIPETIFDPIVFPTIPEHAGLVVVTCGELYSGKGLCYRSEVKRRPRPKKNPNYVVCEKPSDKRIIQFLRLGVLRMWTDTKRFEHFKKVEGKCE